ncbi:MAG: M24 family metallopeptidase [Caldithrix sp.]|nr:M24 family metallopeptidase [Caldithrix sp.]
MLIKERVDALRKLMKKHKIDAYFIPSTDPHQSEYVPALWQRRAWISGFDGSAGDVLITPKTAGLWTDSRYYLQAGEQLSGSGIELFKTGDAETPSILKFLKENLKAGQKVAADARLMSYRQAQEWQNELKNKDIELTFIEENLVDKIWKDQLEMPDDDVMVWDKKYAGESVQDKLARIRNRMSEQGADAHVLTTLDTIAWTFNIRGNDVDFNPVVIAYAIITGDSCSLFLNKKKINRKLKKHLKGEVKLIDYKDFSKHLAKLDKKKNRIWLDDNAVSAWVVNRISKKAQHIFKESPVVRFKARKNDTELAGFRACHIRDGVAMVKFLQWLEQSVPEGGVTEVSAANKLSELRSEDNLYRGPSFGTISSYNEHGAIVHYAPSEETDVPLQAEGIYLVDSGGQYWDGTTDITRTVALGQPTEEQKDRFTRVLKGNIDLAMASFPQGTQGIQLDTLARKPLWDIGLNYGHGTGHGVGAFLNVHEGPQGISYYRGIGVPMEPGMVCSNEPGFYKEREYGMRVENLIFVTPDKKKSGKDFTFYKFENLTVCPIDTTLLDKTMLSKEQLNYLNNYHKWVFDTLSSYLKGDTLDWLKKATKAI